MGKIRLRMIADIYFNLGPIAFIIADFFAIHTDGKDPSQLSNFLRGKLELGKQFPALDGVPNRAPQHGAGDLAFDQVVLGAFLNGLNGKCIIIVTGQDDYRDRGSMGIYRFKGFKAHRSVRKAEIQKNDIKEDAFQYFQAFHQPVNRASQL